MGRLLDILFKRKPDREPNDEPHSPIYVMGGQPVRFLSTLAITTADAALKQSPQLYRIVNFVSSAVQSVPWFCEPDPDVVKSEQASPGTIKALNAVLRSPNDSYTSQQMQYWLTMNLMLYARAHFKIGVNSENKPNGIYPLAAKYMKGIPNSRGVIEGYEYGNGENKTLFPTRRVAERRGPGTSYAAEIFYPSLSGLAEYNKMAAAIESLSLPINIIYSLMLRANDTASGHPNVKYVITAEKTLTRQQKESLIKHMEEAGAGEEHSGEILFLYNTDIKVHTLDNKLSDIHSKLPLDDMTRQIAGVFGVPVALLGLGSADAAKYASNYVESRLSFWQDTIVPSYLSPISSGMTQALCPYGARVRFDLDAIAALWEGRAKLGETLGKVPFLTDGEKREVLDFPKEGAPPKEQQQPVKPAPDETDDDKVVSIHGR